jgi:hypothetical protein
VAARAARARGWVRTGRWVKVKVKMKVKVKG